MASSNVMKCNNIALIICIALMCAPLLSMALTCCDLKPVFAACKEYATHGGTCVPKDCCFEALNVRNMVMSNHKDTVDACHCILDAAGKNPNINGTAFAHIPEGCGIRLPFNFRLGMNCQSGSEKNGRIGTVLARKGRFKKRRMLKRRSSTFVYSSNKTQSSSSGMNDPSFLMVHTCLVAIVEALLIPFHNA